ncbi:flavin-containing monooxygenase [Mycobacterium paraintracellulare]|uniref:flavin-containing monooxygenase n=1 Tax=Mycobacterium paraintracellulare TaxID=1138383 RepID=UPI001928228B|nr:NAD(P)/FAD-dependent oxidoreductase [Mycobacterium paraintracellulare]BCP14254.1 cyclohexanone monooxygenase [Mycobacterium paraintracellulare]
MLTTADEFDVVIAGAGFAGMYMLHSARKLGLRTRVFEKGPSVGGTWYWNRYPGLRCDVESIDYSYSFSDEIQQEWKWKDRYSTRDDIIKYANFVADRLHLRDDIQFSSEIESAAFDEEAKRWRISIACGAVVSAQFFIMATGCLSSPKIPDIAGRDVFTGTLLHTTDWPAEGADFTGQRVGVIGTGSSGIQVIPIVAEQAEHLTVFQRTPSFSLPAHNAAITAEDERLTKANYRAHREAARKSWGGIPYLFGSMTAAEMSPIERQHLMQRVYDRGAPFEFMSIFSDLIIDEAANRIAFEFVAGKIRERVKDPKIAEELIPYGDYIGTRRICIDTNYYETYNRNNVRLVNLKRTPIVSITETGVHTSEDMVALDTIIFATGYDAMTGSIFKVDIRGRGGLALKDKWSNGPRLHLGLMTEGFPNLFFITGPLSPSVLSNVVVSIEQHVQWITECITYLRQRDRVHIEPTPQAEESWVSDCANVAENTLVTKVNSWYMGSNILGKPRIFQLYLGGVAAYRSLCDEAAANNYRGFVIS